MAAPPVSRRELLRDLQSPFLSDEEFACALDQIDSGLARCAAALAPRDIADIQAFRVSSHPGKAGSFGFELDLPLSLLPLKAIAQALRHHVCGVHMARAELEETDPFIIELNNKDLAPHGYTWRLTLQILAISPGSRHAGNV